MTIDRPRIENGSGLKRTYSSCTLFSLSVPRLRRNETHQEADGEVARSGTIEPAMLAAEVALLTMPV